MNQDLKDATRKSLREYVHARIDAAKEYRGMTIEMLAEHSGMTVARTGDILLNNFTPTLDETFMMFDTLGIPLRHLSDHAEKMPYFDGDVVQLEIAK